MPTSWPGIFLLYGIGILAAGQLGILPPLLPAMRSDLGMSLPTAGLAVSIVTMIGAAFGYLAGNWSARLGHGRALAIGMMIMALAAALCATAHSTNVLLAARGAAGAGYLLVVVAAPSLMAGVALHRHHAIVLSLWSTFVPVGLALAGWLTASLDDGVGWRSVLAADAVLLAIGTVVALWAGHRKLESSHPARPMILAGLRPAVPLAIAFFCFALLFLALASLLAGYFVEVRGMSSGAAGRIVAMTTALGIAGSATAGWAMRRGVPPSRLVVLGLLGSAALTMIALQHAMPLPVALAMVAGSFAIGGLVPAAVFASVPLIAANPRSIGAVNGLLAQAGSLGSLAGPPSFALSVEWAGWPLASMLLLTVAAVGAVSARSTRRHASDSD